MGHDAAQCSHWVNLCPGQLAFSCFNLSTTIGTFCKGQKDLINQKWMVKGGGSSKEI